MDPNRTLLNILDALFVSCREEAIEYAENLEHWLSMGGFLPSRAHLATIETTTGETLKYSREAFRVFCEDVRADRVRAIHGPL